MESSCADGESCKDSGGMGDLAQLSKDMKLHIAELKAQLSIGDAEAKDENETTESEVHIPPEVVSADAPPKPPPTNNTPQNHQAADDPVGDVDAADLAPTDATAPVEEIKEGSGLGSQKQELKITSSKMFKKSKRTSLPSESSSSPRSITEGTEETIPVKYLQMSSKSPRPKQIKRPVSDAVCSSDIDSRNIKTDQPTSRSIETKTPRTERQLKYEERIVDLKKKNSELVAIARRLEEKAKTLQEQNVKKSQDLKSVTQDFQQQKRSHQRHRVRCETEHSRALTECELQLRTTQAQLFDLKQAMKQSRREKFVQNVGKDSGDENIFVQNQMEMMKLQKLAATASGKVVIRSLSTPVTARQKILETSNRSLRRQVSALETELQNLHRNSEDRVGSDNLKEEIRVLHEQVVDLESQLGEAKIETSDISIQHQEIKLLHDQLQIDYNTVHEQLAVAISERDCAALHCRELSATISDMEQTIKSFEKTRISFSNLQSEHIETQERHHKDIECIKSQHEVAVSEYEQTLNNLQSKITALEAQCKEQHLNNKNMKQQISELMKLSCWRDSHPSIHNAGDNKNNNNVNHHNSPCATLSHNSRNSDPGMQSGGHDVPQHRGTTPDDTEIEDFYDEIIPHSGDKHSEMIASGLKVFIAKYTYNPLAGPNDQPEAELPLVAGDYVYVCGNVDDDGFYEGELMSGHRGLVPSNFLEPVPEERSLPPHDGRRLSSPGHSSDKHRSAESELSHSYCSSITTSCDLESGEVNDSSSITSNILPYPRKLRVDKKLSHSLIIGWVVPKLDNDEIVEDYHILVDGKLTTVVSGNKSKAVVENIFYDKQRYCISVCALVGHRRSDPMHCFLYYGLGSNGATISNLRVDYLGSSSVRLSWLPAKSNVQHVICMSNTVTKVTQYQRQIVVPSPLYQYTVHGLKVGATYEVIVKIKTKQTGEEASTEPIRFTTTTVAPPSAPSNIQISAKKKDSFELTWSCDDSDDISTYYVYMNGIRIAESVCNQCEIAFNKVMETLPQSGFDVSRLRSQHYTPFIEITLRGKTENGILSDFSTSCTLSENLLERLLTIPLVVEKPLKLRSKDDFYDEAYHPVVPSIEITHDTSSDDEHRPRRRFKENSLQEVVDKAPKSREIPSNLRSATIDSSFFSRDPPVMMRLSQQRPHSEDESCSSSSTSSLNRRHPVEGWEKRPTFHVGGRSSKDHQPRNDEYRYSDRESANNLSPRSQRSRTKDKKCSRSGSSQSGGDSEMEISDSHVGLFVALYDYNPYTMSPNQDCLQDELSFTEGQLIKVYGEKDGDGFYMGEKHSGERGYVPCNMVSEVQVDDYTMLEELFHRGHLPSVSSDVRSSSRNDQFSDHNGSVPGDLLTQDVANELSSELISAAPSSGDTQLYVALFDYDPNESSPNIDAEAELSFVRGDFIRVHGRMDEDGFFQGEKAGRFGLVPSNFLEEVNENTSNHFKPDINGYSAPVPTISTQTMTETTMSANQPLKPSEPCSVASNSSTTSSGKSDGSKRKGIFSKGKQLLKKFGGNESKAKR